MKKLILLTLIAVLPATSFAKVDFNAMIAEGQVNQKQLQDKVEKTLSSAQVKTKKRQRIVVIEEGRAAYTAPSNRDLFIFNKEKVNHKVSTKKSFDRVATELNSLDN